MPKSPNGRDRLLKVLQSLNIQNLAPGGTVQSTNQSPYTQGNNTPTNPFMSQDSGTFKQGMSDAYSQPGNMAGQLANPMASFNSVGQTIGGGIQGFADSMTAQNQFQANAPGIMTANYMPQLGQQYGQFQGLQNQQQQTGNMLAAQAAGQGVNPAQGQYQQNVNDITRQQSGAIASQKGISPALANRMIAQQGGLQKQEAAQRGATLKAQQQLQAQTLLTQQQQNQAQQALAAQQLAIQGNTGQNQAINQGSLGAQGINAQTAQANANAVNQTTGGIMGMLSGSGSAVGSMMGAKGGEVPHFDDGGSVPMPRIEGNSTNPWQTQGGGSGGGGGGAGMLSMLALLNKGGSTGNGPQSRIGRHFSGQPVFTLAQGNTVPGQASVGGDSLKNDTVPAMLSPKEIVLPRSVTLSKDPAGAAARFVAAIKAKDKKKSK